MPGKVVKVLVAVGDEVKAGQGVIVVEAMKMENELKSPKDGKVQARSPSKRVRRSKPARASSRSNSLATLESLVTLESSSRSNGPASRT